MSGSPWVLAVCFKKASIAPLAITNFQNQEDVVEFILADLANRAQIQSFGNVNGGRIGLKLAPSISNKLSNMALLSKGMPDRI